MRTKYIDFKVKSADLEEGIISGYASVFGNVDSYGDIVVEGAFSGFLKRAAESGKVIPVFYGHNMEDPKANIGGTIELREDGRGLFSRHGSTSLVIPMGVWCTSSSKTAGLIHSASATACWMRK